jgi:hypothetical protein
MDGRLLEGEEMAALCREFAISRKTGYKIFDRYKEYGLEALTDRSRRPWRYGNQLPAPVETAILHLKREKPHWGARKIRSAACPTASARITVCPSPRATLCSTSPNFLCGGCGWASPSNAFNPVIRNRTAVMNACISH